MRKHTIILHQLTNISPDSYGELYKELSGHSFDVDFGYGFENVELNRNTIGGTLIKQSASSLKRFDPKTKTIITDTIYLISNIDFFIDIETNILEVLSNYEDSSKLRSSLRKHLDKHIAINLLDLSPHNVLAKLSSLNQSFSIKHLTICNFDFKDGAFGKYIAEISKNTIGYELVENYKFDVIKATIEMKYEDQDIQISFANFGLLQIDCKERVFEDFKKYIKRLLI